MSPVTKFGLLSFASTALAAPWSNPGGYRGHHHSYGHTRPHGSGTGFPTGTGAPFPAGNGTGPYGSGTAASTGFVYSTGYLTVTEIVTKGASATDVAAAAASTSSSCSTPTVSTTTTQILTLTVIPSASGYNTAFDSVPSISTPSDYPVASSTPVAPADTSSSSSAASVAAAGFGGSYGEFSFPWSHASSKTTTKTSAAPKPTTTTTPSPPAPPATTSTTSAAPVETSTTSTTPVFKPTTYSIPAIISTSISIPAIITTSSAAPVVETTTSTSAAPTPSATYGGSSTGSKRGLPYNEVSYTNCFASSKVSWAYNWGSAAGTGLNSDFEYVPQLWSDRSDFLEGWLSNAQASIKAGSKHILGFNEPDLSSQANMLPAAAATAYQTYITDNFKSSGVALGSPAVTNGGGDMGLTWLSSFLDACTDCGISFVAIHWYDSYQNVAYFKQHVTQAHTQTGLPVWITEFGTTDGDDQQIAGFLEEVMPWMDSQDFVERYAYFMASDGLLNAGTEMSTYGQTFATYESS